MLNRSRELRRFTLGSPKAWLGIIYHEVLEKLWSNERPDLDDDELIDHLWESAVERVRQASANHPLDRRFSEHEGWPGYHLTHAMVRMRAREALARQPRFRESPVTTTEERATQTPAREQTLYAMGAKLKGQPDVVTGSEIWEYKSGSVVEQSPDGVEKAKEGYVRQLRLYGHLVHENLGTCPTKGKLLPMQGNPVDIDLTPESCKTEAEEAIDLLDTLNSQISECERIEQLASASEDSCYWCSHKAHCEAFWSAVVEGWWEDRNSAAVSGALSKPPEEVHVGKSIMLTINVSAGNVAPGERAIGPFDKNIHADVDSYSVGDRMRIVGCYRKQDGTLTTTPWTVCFSESEWTEIFAKKPDAG